MSQHILPYKAHFYTLFDIELHIVFKMAANYKLSGLLFVFMICFNHSYMLITFKEEPKTDKSCYVPNDNGIFTTTVSVLDPSVPLDRYTIAWNTNQDGTGTWLINGSECLIYQDSGDHYIQNLRWKATFVYDHRSIFYKMEVKNMKLHDLTPGLYALVIDSKNDLIVARSSGTASFNVELDCPLPIPTNKIPPNTKEISASPTRTSFAAPSSSLGGYKMDSSSSYSTPASSSSPPPPVEGYLSQEWNKLTSHLEEIKNNVNLIPTGTFNAGTISVNIFALFLSIIIGIQLFIPDLYDFIRATCRRRGRQILQQFGEHGTPGENHALNNDALDTSNDPTNTEMKDES